MNKESLKKEIREANKAYRLTSSPIIPDDEYDEKLEELENIATSEEFYEFLDVLKTDVIMGSKRKEKLPHVMASLNKVKTLAEIKAWYKSKNIPDNVTIVLTPKLDGLSLIVDETNGKAWTSGDGAIGQRSDEHFKKLKTGKQGKGLSYGEAIMSKTLFEKKYADKYSNPRNLASGQLNSDDPSEILKDMHYIRYSLPESDTDKSFQIQYCNTLNEYKLPYLITTLAHLTEEKMLSLFNKWRTEFELDGIVIDIDDSTLRKKLGRHSSTDNPEYARAYKGNFEEVKEAKVIKVITKVSKLGYVIPVVVIEPTKLDGAIVSKASMYNYKTVQDMGIGTGAIVTIKRSGQVIPKVIKVIKEAKSIDIPKNCPSCNTVLEWNETNTHLVCENPNCPSQRLQRIISFFTIMKIEEVGKGTLETMYDNGFDTIKKILKMTVNDFLSLPGFANRSADIAYTNIQVKLKGVSLSQLMHASGCFRILGSRKLALVEHLYEENPSIEVLKSINGFSDKSAKAYLRGVSLFKEFIKPLPITVQKAKKESKKITGSKCNGMIVVFTGFRDDDLETKIKEAGGEIGSGVSKKTTHLIMKKKGSGSGKEQKAIDLGIIIWTKEELINFLG